MIKERIKNFIAGLSLKKILSGELLRAGGPFMRNGKFLLFLFSLSLIYIGISNLWGKEIAKTEKYNEQLLRKKEDYHYNFSKLVELKRYTVIRERAYKQGLIDSEEPPIIVKD